MKERPPRRDLEIRRVGQSELPLQEEPMAVLQPLLNPAQDIHADIGARIVNLVGQTGREDFIVHVAGIVEADEVNSQSTASVRCPDIPT